VREHNNKIQDVIFFHKKFAQAQGDKTHLSWHMLFDSKEVFMAIVKIIKPTKDWKNWKDTCRV